MPGHLNRLISVRLLMNRLITPLSGQHLHRTPEKEVNQQTALRAVFLWEKCMSGLHGVETIELTTGTVAVQTISTAVIGLVGT
ncbi:phage tail protein, partial [Escherichia coli]|nr:phage tail protein [Escherichia coli]MCQ5801475.1 phage tail protein [Escherichia coli]MCQ5806296.1 phage tail protein [Escherichia coli]MCQ5811087.1 phage tail protein [Escherichia coli]MCQ5820940.1 phage tail protein [Escherichia coli]